MSPTAALLLVSAVWGGTFVAIKAGLKDASPVMFVGARFLIAAAVASLLVRPSEWRRALPAGIPLGVVLFLGYVTQTQGLLTTTPARSAFLTGLSVPIVPFWGALLLRRFPAGSSVAGLALALPGLWLLTSPGAGRWVVGDAWTLGCAVSFALHVVLVARWAGTAGTTALVAVQLATTAALALAAAPLLETPRFAVTPALGASLLGTALLATAGTTWMQMRYQPRLDPTRAALLYTTEPVFAALFSSACGESVTALAWAGGLLIAAGAAVSELGAAWRGWRERPPPARRG